MPDRQEVVLLPLAWAMGHTGGFVTAVSLVAKEVAQALGETIGPVLVLLDMIEGDLVVARLETVGLLLDAAISLAEASPIGWIVGGIVVALIAILTR